jgi:predicted P-loop ATPase
MIQYCLPNNITLLVTINKFDPNPILVNINKLKPYQFQDTTASRGLESIIERGRDTTNTKIRFNTTTLENAQGINTKFSFLVDGTKIQES